MDVLYQVVHSVYFLKLVPTFHKNLLNILLSLRQASDAASDATTIDIEDVMAVVDDAIFTTTNPLE